MPSDIPWNKNKSQGQKAPFTYQQVQIVRHLLEAAHQLRDLALFTTGIDTMLRSADLLMLKVSDVTDQNGQILEQFQVRQKKTKKKNPCSLSKTTRNVLKQWINESKKLPWDYLFTGQKDPAKPISREHYRRLVKKWASDARLDSKNFSTHSLRRTKAVAVFQATNNVEVVRSILGHQSISATSAYLNINKKQALEVANKVQFFD